jgi:glycerol-3-phosphate acyltransferase PlsY
MWIDALWIIGAYLYGALPVVYLIGRLRGVDLSQEEDMHISLWRNVGRVEGLIGITWDVVKGGVAVVIVDRVLNLETAVVAGVGLAVVVGQMWSVFMNFRGEKGNTTGLGMAMALAYQAMAFPLVPMALGALIRTAPRFLRKGQTTDERLELGGPPSYSLPLGMLGGFALFPVGCWIMDLPWEITIAGIVLFALIVIKRLTAGLLEDLRARRGMTSVLLYRFLFDRADV